MPMIAAPMNGHRWIPTPSIGRGGTKDGNHTYICRACTCKVTKQELINDEVPSICVERRRHPSKAQ